MFLIARKIVKDDNRALKSRHVFCKVRICWLIGQFTRTLCEVSYAFKEITCTLCCFLPLPLKQDLSPHLVKAWKKGQALNLAGPIVLAISWATRYLMFLQVPKTIHRLSTFSFEAAETAKTRISESTVRIETLLAPCFTASAIWRTFSHLPLVHAARPDVFLGFKQST